MLKNKQNINKCMEIIEIYMYFSTYRKFKIVSFININIFFKAVHRIRKFK